MRRKTHTRKRSVEWLKRSTRSGLRRSGDWLRKPIDVWLRSVSKPIDVWLKHVTRSALRRRMAAEVQRRVTVELALRLAESRREAE
jgi:hypothetical protein